MKVAIFGGTFDPIHTAHLEVAREAAERFHLDQLLFIPAARPPHKTHVMGASFEDRLRMVELACAGQRRFIPSRLEAGPEKSYSIYTIEKVLGTLAPTDQLYFLIGADAFSEIETWHRVADVLKSVTFLVVSRPGAQYDVPPTARVERLDTLAMDVSSSDIRAELALGHKPAALPQPVVDYIRANKLYRH